MFQKILIANRGRNRSAHYLARARTWASAPWRCIRRPTGNSLHTRFADEAMCIGPAKSARSYLDIPSVISAAEISNADAVHPGYGFLSENSDFAEVCETSGLKFIGPTPQVIRLMGLKQMARAAMEQAGVPILPGSKGVLKTVEEAQEIAEQIGYPVMLKASAGGGGRGMRMVRTAEALQPMLAQAQAEAAAAFSCGDIYMEKLVENPRHIEFQVLGDQHGNVEVLGERECSIQRRHQKLIEEAPSTAVSPELRERISKSLRTAFQAIGYTSAGTVEFLMDVDGGLHFIEVNARIQVEHPVTEMVTGVDLVAAQIRIAAGERLDQILPSPLRICGHAIECRVNAEDPGNLRAFARTHHRVESSRRRGHSGGHRGVSGRRDSAVLRFAGGQADRAWLGPRAGHRPHAAGSEYVRGGGDLYFDPAAPQDTGSSRLRGREARHGFSRADGPRRRR